MFIEPGACRAAITYYNIKIFEYIIPHMNRAQPEAAVAGDLQAFKAAFFKALAHPVRIRILEVLVRGEHSVQALQDVLGLGQAVVSQQLSVLRSGHIVVGRKDGASVRYRVRDRLVGDLLDVARQIFNNQLAGTQDLLRQLRREHRSRPGSRG
jgi:DNA-binding transcriptional ArsR family regulator